MPANEMPPTPNTGAAEPTATVAARDAALVTACAIMLRAALRLRYRLHNDNTAWKEFGAIAGAAVAAGVDPERGRYYADRILAMVREDVRV
jgi:hypothetical protein